MLMRAGGSEREVVFSLRVGVSDENERQLRAFGNRIIGEERRITRETLKEIEARNTARNAVSMPRQGRAKAGGSPRSNVDVFAKQAVAAEQRAGVEIAKELERQAKEAERIQQREAKARERIAAQAAKARVDEERRAGLAMEKELERQAKDAERAQREQLRSQQRAAEQEEKARDREHQRHRQRQRSIAAANRRERQAEASETAKELSRLEAEHKSARAAVVSGNDAMIESMLGLTEGVMKVGRGFVALGLIGEEDTQKIVDGLLKVQGTFDLLTGGVQTIVRIEKTVRLLRGTLAAADVAQKASAASATLSARATDASTVALTREAAAANAATASHGRLSAARGASGAAGSVRSATGAVSSVGGLGSTVAGIGGTGGAGAAGAISTLGPIIAAAAGVAAAAVSGTSTANAAGKYGIGGGADVGSITDRIATFEVKTASSVERMVSKIGGSFDMLGGAGGMLISRFTGITDAVRELSKSTERLEGAEKNRLELLVRLSRQQEQEAADVRATIQRRSLDIEMSGVAGNFASLSQRITSGDSSEAESAAIGSQLQLVRTTLRDLIGQEQTLLADTEAQAAARTEITRLAKMAMDLEQRKAESELSHLDAADERQRRIAETQQRAQQEEIRGLQERLSLQRQTISEETDRLRSAEERFGSMSPEEQQRLIQLSVRARQTNGRGLSQEQLDSLSGVGTRDIQELVSSERRRRAEAAGFSQFFGGGERQRIADATKESQRLNLEITDQRKIEIEINTTEAREDLARQLNNKLSELDAVYRDFATKLIDQKLSADRLRANTQAAAVSAQE